MKHLLGDLICPVIIVSVFGEISFDLKINSDSLFIADRLYSGILNGGERVRHNGKSGDSSGEPAAYFLVMERHLQAFIAVFVMHVMDDVQSVHIDTCQPFHHVSVFFHHLVIIQIFRCDRAEFWAYLLSGNLIYTAVDGIEQTFCQVGTGTEELHLFADAHGGYTAGNAVVIPVYRAHDIIIFILDGRVAD